MQRDEMENEAREGLPKTKDQKMLRVNYLQQEPGQAETRA